MTRARMIADTLRQEVLSNTLKQNEPLSENDLANRFHTSRTPVREAIQKLESERLVKIVQGRGAFIAPLDMSQVTYVFEVRLALEPLAAGSSFGLIRDSEISLLEKEWLELEQGAGDMDDDFGREIAAIDRKTHHLFTHKTPNPWLRTFLSTLDIHIDRMMNLAVVGLGEASESIRQHLELLSILKSKDKEAFLAALADHIVKSEGYVRSNIHLV